MQGNWSFVVWNSSKFQKTLTKDEKGGILNTKITNNRVENPMDVQKYRKMCAGLKKNGIEVFEAQGDDLRYLKSLGAEASYGNGYIMHVGELPSASAMFEEVIHSTQARIYGEFQTDSSEELCAREIAANRMLIKHKNAYGFDETDIEDINRNLAYWEERFIKEVGCSYDESTYHREI